MQNFSADHCVLAQYQHFKAHLREYRRIRSAQVERSTSILGPGSIRQKKSPEGLVLAQGCLSAHFALTHGPVGVIVVEIVAHAGHKEVGVFDLGQFEPFGELDI